jgi:tetratricopeptide (TPR) repeat protein
LNEQSGSQTAKAHRALYVGVAFAFLFALTWSLSSVFAWIFISCAAYSFFLYWYYLPREARPIEEPFESKTSAERANEIVRKVTRVLWIGAGSVFLFFIAANILSRKKDPNITQGNSVPTASVLEETEEWNAKGYEFYVNQRYDSALYYYDRVLRLESNNTTALYNKGIVHYDQQQMEKAMESFLRAYDAGMRDAFLSHVLGYLNDNNGNTSRAISFYKEAVGLDSTRSEIYARLAELEPGNALKYKELETRWTN